MEPKEVVRYLISSIEPRKEILKEVYCRGVKRGKRIEHWINTEMLAKLLELKEKNEVEKAEGEHSYHIKTGRNFEKCDLWWSNNNKEHWLEVKTIRLHNNYNGLKEKYKRRIKEDLEKIDRLKPPYDFHHLLMVFDDEYYSIRNWRRDVYSLYQQYRMTKEDEWKFDVTPGKTVQAFLHHIKK